MESTKNIITGILKDYDYNDLEIQSFFNSRDALENWLDVYKKSEEEFPYSLDNIVPFSKNYVEKDEMRIYCLPKFNNVANKLLDILMHIDDSKQLYIKGGQGSYEYIVENFSLFDGTMELIYLDKMYGLSAVNSHNNKSHFNLTYFDGIVDSTSILYSTYINDIPKSNRSQRNFTSGLDFTEENQVKAYLRKIETHFFENCYDEESGEWYELKGM